MYTILNHVQKNVHDFSHWVSTMLVSTILECQKKHMIFHIASVQQLWYSTTESSNTDGTTVHMVLLFATTVQYY
jgi:hypothetical protein